jgi:protein involved in sex pheromone biosynthesis
MKKVLFLALAAGMFTFASCDSKKENQAEENAEHVEDAAENKADKMEDAGMDNAADSVREAGEEHADSVDAAH